VEDAVSGVTTVLAIIAPIVLAAFLFLVIFWIIRRRMRRT
jgi:uncharacterized membrane protein YqiK